MGLGGEAMAFWDLVPPEAQSPALGTFSCKAATTEALKRARGGGMSKKKLKRYISTVRIDLTTIHFRTVDALSEEEALENVKRLLEKAMTVTLKQTKPSKTDW